MTDSIATTIEIQFSVADAHAHAASTSHAYAARAMKRGNIGRMIEHTLDANAFENLAYSATRIALSLGGVDA